MAITVDVLKSRIAHIRQELEDVSAALDTLTEAPAARSAALARVDEVERSALLALLAAAYAEMGLDMAGPEITAERGRHVCLLVTATGVTREHSGRLLIDSGTAR